MYTSLPASFRRLLVISAGALPAFTAFAQSEPAANPGTDPVVKLGNYVISASRTPLEPEKVSSAVSVVPLADVAAAQIPTLAGALEQQPGVIMTTNGGFGSQASIFMRGSSSHQTLFVVDGLRMSDRSATFYNFLGGAGLGGLDRLEVLRGPQSTLYGSSAMGGVILMETARGHGALTENMGVTYGSFGNYGAQGWTQGSSGKLGYSASLGYSHTDNDRPENTFKGWSGSTRLEYSATPEVTVGLTFRGQDSNYEEPGSRFFPSPGTVDSSNYLTTVYAEAKPMPGLTSRLTIGQHVRKYTYASAYGTSPLNNKRLLADWQNTWQASAKVQVVGGLNYEDTRYDVMGVSTKDRLLAGYLSATAEISDAFTVNAGVRRDSFRSAGNATTGRAGAAWSPAKGTKLRATWGTAFIAPGTDDIFGVPAFGQLPSPGLLPEKSHGWDAGVDQAILGGKGQLALTYFRNKFTNLFEYEIVDFNTYEGRIVNRARASSAGLEFAASGQLCPQVHVRASYTYLEATNDVNGARLSRRPRHTGDVEVRWDLTKEWTIGTGLHGVADRLNGTTPYEDYTRVRVFAGYHNNRGLRVGVRVENALDESYEEVLGYPALPRGVFGSLEWSF